MQKQQGYLDNDIAHQLGQLKDVYLEIHKYLYKVGCHKDVSMLHRKELQQLIRTARLYDQLEKNLELEFTAIETAVGTIYTHSSHEEIIATSSGLFSDLNYLYTHVGRLHEIFNEHEHQEKASHHVLMCLGHLIQLIEVRGNELLQHPLLRNYLRKTLAS